MRGLIPVVLAAALGLALPLGSAPRAEEPDPRYWRLDAVNAQFASWAATYPTRFRVEVLGLSGEGEPIPLACISDHATGDEPEPRLFFHAAQHANECNGTGAVMRAMAQLLADYDTDAATRARVDGLELWFAPIVNVDGHRYVFGGGPHWADWRKTLRDNDADGLPDYPGDGVDTNRNWDWYWSQSDETNPASLEYKGPFPFSESEVVALRDFVLAERPLLVVDYHSPVTIAWQNFIFWPWYSQHGWGYSPDEPVARPLAVAWGNATLTESGSHFSTFYAYDTLPKEQCWIYGKTGILTFVMEIATECWWTGAPVDSIATRVARGSLTLIDRALHGPGIAGDVTDALTGQPLVAEVVIAELHGPEVGPRLTDARGGRFQRLTLSGNYTLQVAAAGYLPEERSVSVSGGWVEADFALQPDPVAAGLVGAAGALILGPNPLRPGQSLLLALGAEVPPASATLFDVRGRRLARLGEALAPGRSHPLVLPSELPAGVYLLRAEAGPQVLVRRVTLLR